MTATAVPTAIDQELVGKKAELAFGYLAGAVISGMIYLGDRMGLYRALDGAGPVSSAEFASRTGLHERWVREWLMQQAAAGILEYDSGKFTLSPEAALVFADENTPASVIGAFGDLPGEMSHLEQVPEYFRTGVGATYDMGGEAVARSTERMLGPWNRTALVGVAIPALDGVVARLEAGATVADVGCGSGVALVSMAARFPASQFHGYDISKIALERARTNLALAGVANVTLHDASVEPLPATPTFDFVTTLDCLHDMTRPDVVVAAIRKAIKDDGTWFIVDVNCGETFEENLQNPLAGAMYSMSISLCMSSSASSPDGLALGTLGLPAGKMEALVRAAGFTSFGAVPGLEHPFNAFYQVRP